MTPAAPQDAPPACDLDASALAQAVHARELSPVEIVERALQHIEALEPLLNATTAVLADEARAQAADAERAVRAGAPLGPLHGVPVAVKDVIWVAGQPATMASRALADFVAPEDAAAVERLRAAGAIVIAKTTHPEFLWSADTVSDLHGVTRNPWALDRTPGGSSGGSAAAVASRMVPLALGTDAGGSIRVPAAFCGIVGHKPTNGVVPRGPGFEEHRSTNVVGPMARSVRDVALALDAIAGPHPADDLSLPSMGVSMVAALADPYAPRLRVAWSADLGVVDVDPAVRSAFMDLLAALEHAGLQLDEAWPDLPAAESLDPIYFGEVIQLADRDSQLLEPATRAVFEHAQGVSAEDVYAAQLARTEYARRWEAFFASYDLLLTPATPFPAFASGAGATLPSADDAGSTQEDVFFGLSALSSPPNLASSPATAVPIGLTPDGLPIGVQVMGPRFSDARCLRAAQLVEDLVAFTGRPALPPA